MNNYINIDHVSFSYHDSNEPSRIVLNDLSLSINEGEFVAIIGQNGSGKSTLGKLLNALIIPDKGRVFIEGLDTRENANLSSIRRSVGMVFQRPQDQIVATTVSEDISFGPGNLGLPAKEILYRVNRAMDATGLSGFKDRPSYLLSAGETQRVALAGVLAMRPKCIIFDETTAMLDPSGREMVMEQAKALNDQGITILFITHLMEEAAQAERVLVLYRGQIVIDGLPADVFSNTSQIRSFGLDFPPVALVSERLRGYFPSIPENIFHVGELLNNIPAYSGQKRQQTPIILKKKAQVVCVEVDKLSHVYLIGTPLAHQSLNNCSMHIAEGNAHSLIGATGSGKSTLLQHLNGLITPQSGKLRVFDHSLNDPSLDIKALRKTVGFAFQQPEDQIFEQYVGDEVAFAARNFAIPGKVSEIVQSALETVGLDFTAFKDRLTSTLSGGERRKVALASVLAGQPHIIMLDEPLAGLDPLSRRDITEHLAKLKETGRTLIISTHQFEGTIELLDEISVMSKGRDLVHGTPEKIFSDTSNLEAAGIKTPLIACIVKQLCNLKWPISNEIITLAELESSLYSILKGEAS